MKCPRQFPHGKAYLFALRGFAPDDCDLAEAFSVMVAAQSRIAG